MQVGLILIVCSLCYVFIFDWHDTREMTKDQIVEYFQESIENDQHKTPNNDTFSLYHGGFCFYLPFFF